MTTVIFHSADWDGKFCGAIARKFLGEKDVTYIPWDFKDAPINFPREGLVYVMDLPIDRVFAWDYSKPNADVPTKETLNRIIWIDHHISAIETHPTDIPGYRIDGVSACRLAWQWFSKHSNPEDFEMLPTKEEFIGRKVDEPLAVRLAGEYDVHDARMKTDLDIENFQCGLNSVDVNHISHVSQWWEVLLSEESHQAVSLLAHAGVTLKYVRDKEYREVITQQGFDVQFEGLTFLACNSHELDIRSQLFEAGIKPHHDALLGFTLTGRDVRVSMYRIDGKEADILSIAKKYGGGGHPGACGFRWPYFPFEVLPFAMRGDFVDDAPSAPKAATDGPGVKSEDGTVTLREDEIPAYRDYSGAAQTKPDETKADEPKAKPSSDSPEQNPA